MYIFSFIPSLSPSLFAFHVFLPHCAKLKKKCNFLQSVSLLTMTIKYCGNHFLHTLGLLCHTQLLLCISKLYFLANTPGLQSACLVTIFNRIPLDIILETQDLSGHLFQLLIQPESPLNFCLE